MPVIPKSMRANEAFLGDFRVVSSQPTPVLEGLVGLIGTAPVSNHSADDVDTEGLATAYGVPEEELETAVAVLTFLARAVALSEPEADAESEILAFAEDVGLESMSSLWATLSPILQRGRPYQMRVAESLAFHGTPGYDGSDFDVVFRPARSDPKTLLPGIRWTIRYHKASGDSDALSFGLSPAELERIREEADRALDEVAQYRRGGTLEIAQPGELAESALRTGYSFRGASLHGVS